MNISDYFDDEINNLDAIQKELTRVAQCPVNAIIETEKGVKASVQTLAGVVNIVRAFESHEIELLTIWRSSGDEDTEEWDIGIDVMS